MRGRLLAAAVLLLAACTDPEERVARHVERGQALLEQNHVPEAILEFKSALNDRPDDPDLYERIGDLLSTRGQFEEAARYYERTCELDASRIPAAMKLARLIAASRPARARELLDRGLRDAPNLAIVQRAATDVALAEHDTAGALEAARKAVAIDAADVENWVSLGTAQQGRIRERLALRLPPDDDAFRDTIATFEHVDEMLGGSPRARLEKARLLAAWPGHRAEATATHRDALQLALETNSPLEVALASRAVEQYAREIHDKALRHEALTHLVHADPTDYSAWEDLGRMDGEPVYLDMLQQRGDDPVAHLLYAGFLERKRRIGDAEAHLERQLERPAKSPLIYARLVRMRIQTGRLADAHATYVRMSADFPTDFETRLAHARLSLAEGRAAEAAVELEPLVAERKSSELLRLLALARLRLGDLPGASATIERAAALESRPNYAVLRLKARIAHDSQHWREAVAAYTILVGRGQRLGVDERVRLVRSLYHTGRRDPGRKQLEDLLASTPPPAGAAVAFAELEGADDPSRARALLMAALAGEPGEPDLVQALTDLDLRGGHADAALQRLDHLVESGQASPQTLLLRARVRAQAGDYPGAEADALRVFEAAPMLPGAMELLFSVYRQQGHLPQAQRSFEEADAAGVLHPAGRYLLARIYLEAAEWARARKELERVVQDSPDLWAAKNDLAFVLAQQQEDLDRALGLAREANEAAGRTAATTDTVGFVHLKAGRGEAALEEFQRAIHIAQQRHESVQASHQYHAGLALVSLGRYQEAIRAFESALGEGDFAEADDARRQLEAARHHEPESPSPS